MWRAQESRDASFLNVKIGAGRSNSSDLMDTSHLDGKVTDMLHKGYAAAKKGVTKAAHYAEEKGSAALQAIKEKAQNGKKMYDRTVSNKFLAALSDIKTKVGEAAKHNPNLGLAPDSELIDEANTFLVVQWVNKEHPGIKYLAWPTAVFDDSKKKLEARVHILVANKDWVPIEDQTLPFEEFDPAKVSQINEKSEVKHTEQGEHPATQSSRFDGVPVDLHLCAQAILARQRYNV